MNEFADLPRGRSYDLLAFGDPNIDLLFTVARTPQADEKVLGRRLPSCAGGTVANVACAASLLGRPTLAYGRVGSDADGDFLLREYARFGVGTAHVRTVAGSASATALIMIEASGEKSLVYAPMPGPTLLQETLAPALADCRMLYAMPYDIDEFTQLAQLARQAGVALAIDVEAVMAPDLAHFKRLLALSDLVFMNDASYRAIVGREPQLAGLRLLLDDGPRMLVVTCGARGAMAASRHDAALQPAFPATLVDSTGAGDSFNGAFLAALLEGQDLSAALRFACAAASVAVTAVGARTALPDRAQVGAVLAARAPASPEP